MDNGKLAFDYPVNPLADFSGDEWMPLMRTYDSYDEYQKAVFNEGWKRHITACKKVGMEPEFSCAREILSDARYLRRFWRESDEEIRRNGL